MGILDDKIAAIEAAVAQLGTDLTAEIDDMRAKIAAGQQPTQEQLDRLGGIATSLTNLSAQAKAE